MKTLSEIAEHLSQIDLMRTSTSAVLDVMRQIPKLGMVGFELQKGQPILRTRTRGGEFPLSWRTERDITYPDAGRAAHGRASFQGNPVFYGCVGKLEDFEVARQLSIHEANKLMHDPSFAHAEEFAVVGNWRVQHPVNVIAVVQSTRLHGKNVALREEHERYLHELDTTVEDKEGCIKLSTFLADEFSKEVIRENGWEYKISAAFSQRVMEMGMDGVAYPSARAEGDGNAYNVALKPEVIDGSCKLVAAYAYRLIKHDHKTLVPLPYLGDRAVTSAFEWQDPGPMPRPHLLREQLRRQHERDAEVPDEEIRATT